MMNFFGEFQRPSLLKMASTKLSRFQAGFEARTSNWQWSKSGGAWRGYGTLLISMDSWGKNGKNLRENSWLTKVLLYQRSGKSKPEAEG